MATATQIKAFIQQLGRLAVAECNRRIGLGLPFILPSVCIAQSAHETGWGTAGIMTRANAFFGIKAGGSWTGKVYRADTWEVANGTAYNTTANFRAYDTVNASVIDYYDLISNSSRYSSALSSGSNSGAWLSPKQTISAIHAGGYATDTLYVQKIMNIINGRDLTQYDALITGDYVAPLPDKTYVFNKSDLVQGKLVIIDSGRAVENDRTNLNAVALDWGKVKEIQGPTRYVLNGLPENHSLSIVALKGDTATNLAQLQDGDTIELAQYDKVGFYIERLDGDVLELADIDSNFELSLSTSDLPEGSENYSSTLAFFVKVE